MWNERASANSRKVPVEVVVNGHSVAKQEIEADGQLRDIAFTVPIERSSWVALRVLPSSHTNPIWVTVDGKPVRASKRSAQWLRQAVDVCYKSKIGRVRLEEQGELGRAYDHARADVRSPDQRIACGLSERMLARLQRKAHSIAGFLRLVDAVDHLDGPPSVFLVAAGLAVALDRTHQIGHH